MNNWDSLAKKLGLEEGCEAVLHPHAPEERAELFHAANGGSTEYEYLTLLNALVFATKPKLVIETGTHHGFGTLALASAIAANGFGKLVTVDIGGCEGARRACAEHGLEKWVEFQQSDSIQFCATWTGEPFDFAFFDSELHLRHRECDLLLRRDKFSPGALAVFHDASPLRYGVAASMEMIQYLDRLPGGLMLPLSL